MLRRTIARKRFRAGIAAALSAAVMTGVLAAACNGGGQQQQQAQTPPAVAQAQQQQQQGQPAVVQQQQSGQAQQQGQPAQQQSGQQAGQAQQQARPTLEPTVQNFANIVDDWLSSLTSLRIVNSLTIDDEVADSVLRAEFSFTRDAVYIETDELPLLGGEAAFPGLQLLWTEAGVWLSAAPLAGWMPFEALFGAPAAPAETGIVRLSGLQSRRALYPSNATVMEASLDGRLVWELSYELSGVQLSSFLASSPEAAADPYSAMNPLGVDLLGVLAALEIGEPSPVQLQRLAARMIADPISGELLGVEMTADLPEGPQEMITRLASWNEPLEIPQPQPAATVDEFVAVFFESAMALAKVEDGNPYAMLANARDSIEQAAAIHMVQEISGTVGGEARAARTEIKLDRAGGRIEIATEVDGSEPYRLLWTREGLWLADSAGRWQPTSPAVVGLGEYAGVDEYLTDAIQAGDDAVLFARATVTRVLSGPDGGAIDIETETTRDERMAAPELVSQLLIEAAGPLIGLDAAIEDVLALGLRARVAADEATPLSRTVEARFTAAGVEYEIRSDTAFRDPAGISFSAPG